jgi:hypothetical protein
LVRLLEEFFFLFGFGNFHIKQPSPQVSTFGLKQKPEAGIIEDFCVSNLTPAVDHQEWNLPRTIMELIEDEHFTVFITVHRQESERYVSVH